MSSERCKYENVIEVFLRYAFAVDQASATLQLRLDPKVIL